MSSLNLHGELLEDGNWNGIIGMLAARQVDASCSDLTMTTSRVNAVDFIESVWTDRYIQTDQSYVTAPKYS